MPRVTVHSFNSSVCHGCSHRIHDAYAFMLGVYRGHTLLDKKKKEIIRKKGYLQILTIWKHAHLCVTSTKVNQPNKLKACMHILYIHYYIYIGHTLYGRIWLQPCDFFLQLNANHSFKFIQYITCTYMVHRLKINIDILHVITLFH